MIYDFPNSIIASEGVNRLKMWYAYNNKFVTRKFRISKILDVISKTK